MSNFDDGQTCGKQIGPTPENEALLGSFVSGVSSALTCEAVHTFEATSTITRLPSAPNRYLARAVIYQYCEDDADTTSPDFQVALTLKANQLNANNVQDLSPSDAEELGFVDSDGLQIQLIDYRRRDAYYWFGTYSWGGFAAIGGIACGFDPEAPKESGNPVLEATGSGVNFASSAVLNLSPNYLKGMDILRAITLVLGHGGVDLASTDRLAKILETRDSTKLLTMDRATMISGSPHFKNILEGALSVPSIGGWFSKTSEK